MTIYMFFDTETTGLPTKRNCSALMQEGVWPNIVSISWSVFDDRINTHKKSYIIKPMGWRIPEDSVKIHGITNEQAQQGVELEKVMDEFIKDIENANTIIAHNMEFDKNVVFNAIKWILKKDPNNFWNPTKEYCTMRMSKNELKIATKRKWDAMNDPYKFPGLDELYQDTFKEPAPKGAHNAERDVDVLQKIFWKRYVDKKYIFV